MDLFNKYFYNKPEHIHHIAMDIIKDKTYMMPYGKYKGVLVSELFKNVEKIGYLYWLLQTFVPSGKELPFPREWCGAICTRAEQFGWVYDDQKKRCFKRIG